MKMCGYREGRGTRISDPPRQAAWPKCGAFNTYGGTTIAVPLVKLKQMQVDMGNLVRLGLVLMHVALLRVGKACVPPPAVECNANSGCQIFNYQGVWEGGSVCKAESAVYPKTEAELLHAVADAVKKKRKIKVISAFSHSLTKLVCGAGVVISTRDYDSTIRVDREAMTITVDPGVMIRDVIRAAAAQGLALPASTYWDGVSAAGVVSTGAHGSGLSGRGSALHEYVVGMRMVVPASAAHGYAKVVTLGPGDEDFKAARLSLGVLGAISGITFALEPMFKRSLSFTLEDDVGLQDIIHDFLRDHEFGDAWWYPAHAKVLLGRVDRVPVDSVGDGFNRMAQLGQPTTVDDAELTAASLEAMERAEDAEAVCKVAESSMKARVPSGGGLMNGAAGFTGYPVVGFNHRMQATGGCQDYTHKREPNPAACAADRIWDGNESICSWDRRARGLKGFDVEIYVALSRVRDAILDVKKIRDAYPKALCELEVVEGICMRSVKRSEAFLGHPEDVVTFELEYLRPRDAHTPKWNMEVYEEMEQMLVEKHGATLHWGKSGGHLFEGTAHRAVSLPKFLAVKNKLDADALFSNDWTDALFGIGGKRVEVLTDGCALQKLCKCREDKHCAPHKGYFCRPGRVWKEARVCRKEVTLDPSHHCDWPLEG